MSEWKRKRFWSRAETAETEAGHAVLLDGRPLRTPAKAPLHLPTAALAAAVAGEWGAQGEIVDPLSMPLTRTANSAIDTVAAHPAQVAAHVAAYGENDLLCYRAEAPEELAARQAAGWDPLIDWAATALQAPLRIGTGVMHIPQPQDSVARLGARVRALDPFRLAALHELVTLSGSLILGLAALERQRPLAELWALSRIDEDWQAEQWGIDEEAAETAALKAQSFDDAGRFLFLCDGSETA